MRVLIVGAGIAGPTLAYWLVRAGHAVTIVERAPAVREGGYIIDFWGAGFEVAERMGIVPRLMREGYVVEELREVDARGAPIAHMDPRRLIDAAGGRYVSVARSDLARSIYDAIPAAPGGEVETIFGETVAAIVDDGDRVFVRFAGGAAREFDLVVGADGLHSHVRALAFSARGEAEAVRDLGIAVAVFDVAGYRPRDELVAVTHTEVGVQSLRFAQRDGSTMFCFTFRHDGPVPIDDVAAQQELLRERLRGVGWEVPQILARMPEARTFYMDRATQIRLPTWSRGRVALVGDAAACPSLLAGQGSALAMAEAYVLAAELQRTDNHRAAFAAYERRLAGEVRAKQDAAIGFGDAFAPRSRWRLLLRNRTLALLAIPVVARLALGRSLRDRIDLDGR